LMAAAPRPTQLDKPPKTAAEPPFRPRTRRNERDPFRCGRCRAFVGPTVSGGRHRNHCPICLTSRHVDARRPGDRMSPCRALMAPVGTLFRPDGEQMIVHRCNGCGVERRCRVAADDNPEALLRLPPVVPAVDDADADDAAIA
jgi:RNHCP domain-containing protein